MVDKYWTQFMHTVFWDRTPRVEGVLEARASEGPKDDPYPVLVLRTKNGYKLKINVTQTRLLSELVRQRPEIGDHLEIVFDGLAPKAPPGMSPAKEFTVHVTPKAPGPRSGTDQGIRGSASENVPGTGAA